MELIWIIIIICGITLLFDGVRLVILWARLRQAERREHGHEI